MKKIYLVMLTGALTLCIGGCGTETINLNDEIQISVSGVSGRGTLNLNTVGLEEELYRILKNQKGKKSEWDYFEALNDIDQALNIDVEKTEGLSNGDKIKINCEIDKKALKQYKIKTKFSPYTYVVEGLKEVPYLTQEDIFKDVTVVFSGTEPYGKAEIECGNNSLLRKNNYKLDKTGNLSNGDKMTIICNVQDTENYLVPDNLTLTKELTVEGIDRMAEDFSDLNPEMLLEYSDLVIEAMEAGKSAKSMVTGGFGKEGLWGNIQMDSDGITMSNARLEKIYLEVPKDKEHYGGPKNTITFLFRVDTNFDNVSMLFSTVNFNAPGAYISHEVSDIVVDSEGNSNINFHPAEIRLRGTELFNVWYSNCIDTQSQKVQEIEADELMAN